MQYDNDDDDDDDNDSVHDNEDNHDTEYDDRGDTYSNDAIEQIMVDINDEHLDSKNTNSRIMTFMTDKRHMIFWSVKL